jgi:Protein of unknown function (DUF3800)
VSTLYAYIDESGDEGFSKFSPHTDVTAYNDRSKGVSGPSVFFMMCAALVEDTLRSTNQVAVRALSRQLFPKAVDKEIHWRDLDWERKEAAAEACAELDFMWVAVVAYKPLVAKAYPPPYLYNWCTRLLLERLCLEANSRGASLVPVFSNRSRTNYPDLQRYVSAEVTAFGAAANCLKPIRVRHNSKERLLQLTDMCAGTLHNALEVNNYGKLQTHFLKATAPRLRRVNGKAWKVGLKFYPDTAGLNFGPPTRWIDAVRKK